MADVANSVSASSPSGASTGLSLLSDSPDLGMISPGVKEAMDRIFPKSASQLLQHRPSQDNCDGPSTGGALLEETSIFHRRDSNSAGRLTKESNQPRANSPVLPTETSPAMPQTKSHLVVKAVNSEAPHSPERKPISKLRISKADMEIMRSYHSDFSDLSDKNSLDTSKNNQGKSKENSTDDCHTVISSDSEDMCRPFASVVKAKKKEKRHKKKKKKDMDNRQQNLSDSLLDSEEEFQMGKRKTRNDINLSEKNLSQRVVIKVFEEDSVISIKETAAKQSNSSSRKSSQSLEVEDSNTDVCVPHEVMTLDSSQHSSQTSLCDNWPVSDSGSAKDNALAADDVSNISFSSSKENVHSSVKSGLKLPKVRKPCYDVKSDKRRIRNAFPPCFVVLPTLGEIPLFCTKDRWARIDHIIPLSERWNSLKDLCARGGMKCKQRKKKLKESLSSHQVVHHYPGQSEEEFEAARGGRSLRKRNQNISYAEPSEFSEDFVDAESRPRKSRNKELSSDPEAENSKKKRKVDKVNVNGDVGENSKEQKKAGRYHKSPNVIEKKAADGTTQVYVYPKSCVRVDSSEPSKSKKSDGKADKSKTSPSVSKSLAPIPRSSNVSVLMNNSGGLQALPATAFPPMPLGLTGGLMPLASRPIIPPLFPSSVAATSVVSNSTFPLPVSTAAGKPQYCMMKMDGKDVLVQVMPSGMFGSAYSGIPPVVFPGGKRLVLAPPAALAGATGQPRVIGQTILRRAPAPSVTQVSQASVSNVTSSGIMATPTSLSAAALVNTSIGSGSVPVFSPRQLGRIAGISGSQAFTLAPGSLLTSTSSLSTISAPVVSMPPTVTSVSTSVPIVRSTSALTPMAAPSSTTVVHTARTTGLVTRPSATASTALPGNVRSLRMFVPGCSATGTPGHFTTLASVSGSPLTRLSASSELLPQRKRSAEKELTPEQRAAKRRKLEKKYPLPPGVVIKTEPEDTPTSSSSPKSSNPGMRSLLRQNIQVISTSRVSGGSVQSIRIISPSLATALSNRPVVRPGSNIMYRAAAGVGGRQTVLVPITMTSSSASTTSSFLVSFSSLVSSSSSTTTSSTVSSVAASRAATSTSSVTTVTPSISTLVSSIASTSVSSSTGSPGEGLSAVRDTSTSSGASSSSTSSTRCLTTITSEGTAQTTESSDSITTPSLNSSSASSGSGSDTLVSGSTTTSIATSETSLTTSMVSSSSPAAPSTETTDISSAAVPDSDEANLLHTTQTAVTNLKKIVKAQEALGLKGERLEKLRTLLRQKEESLKSLQKSVISGTGFSALSDDTPTSSADALTSGDSNGHNGTETDPFVID